MPLGSRTWTYSPAAPTLGLVLLLITYLFGSLLHAWREVARCLARIVETVL